LYSGVTITRASARDGAAETLVIDRPALVLRRERQLAHVDQLRLDAAALSDFAEDEPRRVFAHATLTRRAEDDWDEEWPFCAHGFDPFVSRRDEC
jgi:hypothetical protein